MTDEQWDAERLDAAIQDFATVVIMAQKPEHGGMRKELKQTRERIHEIARLLSASKPSARGVPVDFKEWFEREWAAYEDKAISGGKVVSMAWALKGYRASHAAPSVEQDEREVSQLIDERDSFEHMGTVLANKVAELLDADVGEWSSANNPIFRAIHLIEDRLANVAQGAEHPDDVAVDRFAAAMKDKLAAARAKGRSGWQQCSPFVLSEMLRAHVDKGDPRDVANFCMMLWNLDWSIAAPPEQTAQPAVVLDDEQRTAVRDAIAGALGEAYDCGRVWSAWGYGTMSSDDFSLVAEDDARLDEITDAAIGALAIAQPDQPTPSCMDGGEDAVEMARKDGLLDAPADDARDAARYRAFFDAGLPITFCGVDYFDKASLDEAIDAALTAAQSGSGG